MDAAVLALVLLFCPGTRAQSSSADTECSLSQEHRADVVLLLDGFNHISPDDFSRVRDSLQTLVRMLGPVGPDLVRVALVKYGRDPETEFYLNTFQNLSSVVDAVSRMSQSPPFPGGSTGDAVKFIRRKTTTAERGDRRNVPDSLILITDRNSSGVYKDLLSGLWEVDVKVFVVGVKVTAEFQVRMTDHDDAEVFTVEDYHSLKNIVKEVTQSLCRWIKVKGRSQPQSLRFTDVQSRRTRVSWDCHSQHVERFELSVYLDTSDLFVQMIGAVGHKRSAVIPQLLPNTAYRVSATARERTGRSHTETAFLTTPQDGVRLRGGPGRCSGSVEVLMDQSWSSVCGRGFGLTEAAVVCEELDCGAVSELHQGALFSEGPAVGRSFHCEGAETSLKECESSETRCSTAANLTCSDAVLRFAKYNCAGDMSLKYKKEWRAVMTTGDPDLDFGSVLCDQLGCGSALTVECYKSYSRSFWHLEPECVKQRSGLTGCLDLDSHTNKTKNHLFLICSEFVPVIKTSVFSEGVSVSSEGVSISSEGVSDSSAEVSFSSEWMSVSSEEVCVSSERVSQVQKVFLKQGSNFSVSCSLDEPFLPGQLHLLSPTGNYTQPAVNHSAHFLFQAFNPAHIGNYTCVYRFNKPFVIDTLRSTTLYISPEAMLGAEEPEQTL